MNIEFITYPTGLVGIEVEQCDTSPTMGQVAEAIKEFCPEVQFHFLKPPEHPDPEYPGLLLGFDIDKTSFEVMYMDYPAGAIICVQSGDHELLRKLYGFLKNAK